MYNINNMELKMDKQITPIADESQKSFIQNAIDTNTKASVFLCNGIKLVGNILSQSDKVIIMSTLKSPDPTLVYLNSVSTIKV